MVCVVDDAHWLDPATADALLFCASRIGADRVAMVFAARDDAAATFEAPGFAELALTGLGPDAARALLGTHLEGAPVEEVTRRLIAETGGNPLALLELPTELTAAQLNGAVPAARPVPPDRTNGASLPRPEPEVVRRRPDDAAARRRRRHRRGRGAQTCGEVPRSGRGTPWRPRLGPGLLVEDGPVVAVRHPLVRSAIYQAATGEGRRRAHRALAEALSGSGDPDRQTWHRAAAAEGRTTSWSPPSGRSGRGPSDAAGTPRPSRPSSERRTWRPTPSSEPD